MTSTSPSRVAAAQQASIRLERGRIDLLDGTRHETEAPPRLLRAPPDQPQQRRTWAAGESKPDVLQPSAQERQAAIDVPAGQKLFGRTALQFHRPRALRRRRRAQEGLSCLGGPPGVGERRREALLPRLCIRR